MEIIKKLEKNKIIDSIFELVSTTLFSIFHNYTRKNLSDNIIIISLHKLGDTVFTIPAILQVFEHFPHKNVFVLTFSENRNIYNIVIKNESIITLQKDSSFLGGRIALKNARNILKNLHPNTIFDLTGNIASASLIANSKSKEIVGMNTKYCKTLYDVFVPIRNNPHLIDRYLDVINKYFNLDKNKIIKEFPVKFQTNGKILIHPFAGWKAKEWNLNKFIKLAELLNEDYEIEVVSPENLIPEDIIQDIRDHKIQLSFSTSINDLVNKIKECSIFISNDSGPLYIANLLGKATFTIYGPTNPEFSLPFGKYHRYIQKKMECSPNGAQYCFTLAGLNCPSNECMRLLHVKEVHSTLRSFLSELQIKRK